MTSVLSSTMQSPQLHCRDFRVRLNIHDLRRVAFEHLLTFRDIDVMVDAARCFNRACVAGSTDWWASVDGVGVSLEWDWILGADGSVAVFEDAAPRTNLCLIGPHGYDLDEDGQRNGLWAAIESITWRGAVTSHLASASAAGSATGAARVPRLVM